MKDALHLPTGGWLDLWLHDAYRSAGWYMFVILFVFNCMHVFVSVCLHLYALLFVLLL